MSFAHPWWLMLAPMVGALVVMLHMRRRTRRTVSSLVVWRRVMTSSVPSANWRRPPLSLSLLLQLFAIAFLALAAAGLRPERSEGQHTLFLIDASASMGARIEDRSIFEQARGQIEARAHEPGVWSVASVAGELRPIAWRFEDRGDLARRLDRDLMAPEASRSDWAAAAAFTSHLEGLDIPDRIVLISDETELASSTFHDYGLDVDAVPLAGATADVGLVHADVAAIPQSDGPRNAASPSASGQRVRLRTVIGTSGDVAGTARLEIGFRPDGATSFLAWGEAGTTLEDGSTNTTDIVLPGSGMLRISLVGDGDEGLPGWNANDVLYLSVETDTSPRTVRFSGGHDATWERLIDTIQHVDVRPESTADVPDATIAWTAGDTPDTGAAWFLAHGPSITDRDWVRDTAVTWEDSGSLGVGLDWASLPMLVVRPSSRIPGADVLVEGGAGPWVQTRVINGRREVHTSFDPAELSRLDGAVLPAFVLNATEWLVPRQVVCRVGVPCPLAQGASVTDPSGVIVAAATPNPDATPRPPRFVPRRSGLHAVINEASEFEIAVLPPTGQDRPGEEGATMTDVGSPGVWSRTSARRILPWSIALVLIAIDGSLAVRRSRHESATVIRHGIDRRRAIATVAWTTACIVALVAGLVATPFPLRLVERSLVVVSDRQDSPLAATLTETSNRSTKVISHAVASGAPDGAHALATATVMAAARIPEHGAARIVLDGMGTSTGDDASLAAPTLASRDIEVVLVRDEAASFAPIELGAVHAPDRVTPSTPSDARIEVWSQDGRDVRLRIDRGDMPTIERTVRLAAGASLLSVPIEATQPGTLRYDLSLQAADDATIEATTSFLIDVEATPVWWLFTPLPERGDALADALRLQGLDVVVRPPHQAPFDEDGWHAATGTILVDVPAIELHPDQRQAMHAFVADQGGGLVLFGGRRTFGPGGYYETLLDRLSPLSSRVERDAPEVSIAFVLDRSGSMQQRVGDTNRLAIATDATLAALSLLGEESRATVVAFDEQAEVIAPLQRLSDIDSIRVRLSSLVPGGGTSILPGIEAALQELAGSDSAARHMVVMSDGLSQPGAFEEIVARAREEEITISTVAIGRGADTDRLATIADLGRGTAHVSEDFRALPGILSQEALLLSTSPVREEAIRPRWAPGERAGFLEGWPEDPPLLNGFVETTAKAQADVHLFGPDDEPILASWRFGLGRVVAFTSQAVGPWTADWQAHEAFPSWWTQVARWSASSESVGEPALSVTSDAGSVRIDLQPGRASDEVQATDVTIRLTGPSQERSMTLHPTVEGTWTARTPASPGRYDVRVASGPDTIVGLSGQTIVSRVRASGWHEGPSGDVASLIAHSGGNIGGVDVAKAPLSATAYWRLRSDARPWAVLTLVSLLFALTLRYAPGLLRSRFSLRNRNRQAGDA